MSVRLKLIMFLSLLFIVSIGNLYLTFKLEVNGEDKLKWVIHTHEVIHNTEKLTNALKDAETGQRGYLLTQSPAYLEPYYSGIKVSEALLKQLLHQTLDNPKQQANLKDLAVLIQDKLNALNKTVTLTEQNKLEEAMLFVNSNQGKVFMDNIRAKLDQFVAQEHLLLEVRNGEFKSYRAQITTLISVGIVSMVFLAILTFMFLRKNLFSPLNMLLACTHKMENGEKLNVNDVVEKDELGSLLSAFFQMNEKVHNKTQDLNYKANHDELTGLKNRSTLYAELESAIEQDDKQGLKTSVFFLDLDNFKQLNDTLGHDVGDMILKETAKRLKNCIRQTDSVFRLGGDEFLLIMRNIDDENHVHSVANDLLNRFKAPMQIAGHNIEIYPSVGIAIAPNDTNDSEQIIKYSDIAMYKSKRDRKVNYRMFDKNMLKTG